MQRLRLGELLVQAKLLTPKQLEDALALQKAQASWGPASQGKKLGQVLIDLGIVNETQLTQVLGQQLSVPWVSLYHIDFSRQLLNLVPREIADRYCLVPIFVRRVRKQGETLYVAMDDPTHEAALEAVRASSSLPVRPMIAASSDIRSAIRAYYGGEEPDIAAVSSTLTPLEPVHETLRGTAVGPPHPLPPPTPPAQPPPVPKSPRLELVPEVGPEASGGADSSLATPSTLDRRVPPPPAAEGSRESSPDLAASPGSRPDSPDAWPEVEARTMELPKRKGQPRMVALTLLDGSTIHLPAKPQRAARLRHVDTTEPTSEGAGESQEHHSVLPPDMTARDSIKALRAVAEGADARAVFGERVPLEAIVASILSVLLRKGLLADWEFVEELRKK